MSVQQQQIVGGDPRQKKGVSFGIKGPGPGQYNILSDIEFRKSKNTTIPKKKRFNGIWEQTPSATKYSPTFIFKNSASAVMGTAKRKLTQEPLDYQKAPPSYQYLTDYSACLGPYKGKIGGYSKKNVQYVGEVNEFPGPGAYLVMMQEELRGGKRSSQAGTFSKAQRQILKESGEGSPGPGEYEMVPENPKYGQKISTSKRLLSFEGSVVDKIDRIGPGSYLTELADNIIKSSPKVQKFSKAGRLETIQKNIGGQQQTPGPGNYDTNQSTLGIKSVSIGSGSRVDFTKGKIAPGPGKYNINEEDKISFYNKKTQQTFFKQENSKNWQIPGPGTYSPKELSKDLSAYKIFTTSERQFKQQFILNNTPGPQDYYVSINNNSSPNAVKFPQSIRKLGSDIIYKTPGPGAYNVNNDQNLQIKRAVTLKTEI